MEEGRISEEPETLADGITNQQTDDSRGAGASTKLIENGGKSSTSILYEDEWEDYIPDPPDGGWGWVIAIASFFNNFLVDGIAYCFGVYLVTFTDAFETTVAKVSLASALICGVYQLVDVDEYEDYVPEPPDGGWGWMICLASFFNNFILDGIANTFGVFLRKYSNFFETGVAATSLSNSLICGSYLAIGPVAGALVNTYGCRLVGIAGSIMAAVAFILSTFSTSIYVFQITYGVMGGIGFGLLYLPAVVGVGFYFEKKRALATGIAVCGTGIGTFAMAPFASFLLSQYDWKNTHYILAGLILQGCVFSSLMRPLKGRRRKPPKEIKTRPLPDVVVTSSHGSQGGAFTQVNYTTDQSKQFDVIALQPTTSKMTQSSSVLHHSGKSHHSQKLHASAFIGPSTRTPKEIVEDLRRPLYRRDIFLSTILPNPAVPVDSSTESIPISELKSYRLSCLNKLPKPMADILAEMIDPHILKNKGMLLLALANLFGMIGFYVPIIFSSDRAISLGINKEDAALLLSIMGICNTAGRVLTGAVAFIPKVSPLLVNNICTTLAGVSVLITPFCTTYPTMALAIAGYGLFASSFISLSPVIICNLVGLDNLTNGFGLICLVRGIAAVAGPPLEGLLYDSTGDYNATFYMGGSCILISALLHFTLLCVSGADGDRGEEKKTKSG